MFKRDAEQAEMWITMREALLGTDDIGVRHVHVTLLAFFSFFKSNCIIYSHSPKYAGFSGHSGRTAQTSRGL